MPSPNTAPVALNLSPLTASDASECPDCDGMGVVDARRDEYASCPSCHQHGDTSLCSSCAREHTIGEPTRDDMLAVVLVAPSSTYGRVVVERHSQRACKRAECLGEAVSRVVEAVAKLHTSRSCRCTSTYDCVPCVEAAMSMRGAA